MKNKTTEVIASSISLISANTKIVGEVHSDSDIRIDGTIDGNIHSKAKVVLGTSAQLKGNIVCQNADISGTVKGNITITETLFLKATAKINGDIYTSKLVVEPGASFTGNCNMGPLVKDIKYIDKPGTANTLKEKTA